ncbi:MAG: YnbE family lipoprotein [Planctomycetes bacterium]|nr:YnbE family lipoprotein [Planctomycetota bacterium]
MRQWLLAGAMAALAPACTRHTVKLEPIEIKPIHITMDINIKVDKQLDSFFDFEKQSEPKAPDWWRTRMPTARPFTS